jgi:ribonuclease HII
MSRLVAENNRSAPANTPTHRLSFHRHFFSQPWRGRRRCDSLAAQRKARFVASGVKNIKKKAAPPRPLMTTPHFDFEREAFANGHLWVAGVDEVGRGPLAGPVGVAAVILDPDDLPEGLNDSKVLPALARESLCEIIFAKALSVSVVFASVEEIDLFNIRGAALRAMTRSIAALSVRPHFALIDGRDLPEGLICPARPIIDGDALSMSIAAASIVAKTMRDALMRNLGLEYPQYGFGDHAGYATVAHRRALASAGPCPYHRRSFRLEPQQE